MTDVSSHNTDMIAYDPEKHYLGKLCKRGHDYRGTGRSLRYKKYVCIECKRVYYLENREAIRAKQQQERAANPELKRQYASAYYRANRDRFSTYNKARYDSRKHAQEHDF